MVADPPEAAIMLVGAGDPYTAAAIAGEVQRVATSRPGERNDALNRAAFSLGQFVDSGRMTEMEAWAALLDAAQLCGLVHDDGEQSVKATIASGLGGARLKPRTRFDTLTGEVQDFRGGLPGELSGELSGQVDAGRVATFWARPVHAHIRQFALSRMCAPWAVLGGCLLRAMSTIPTAVVLPPIIGGVGSVNLLVALVAPSGSGKGASEAAARDALTWPKVSTAPLGSGEGMTHAYAVPERRGKGGEDSHDPGIVGDGLEWITRSIIFDAPEIDQVAALQNRRGSTLMGQLRSAYSGERLGFQYADSSRRIILPPHSYRFGLSLGVQPRRAGFLLDDADGGTPQRFLWLPATDPAITADPPPEPEPWGWTAPLFRSPPLPRTAQGYTLITVPDCAVVSIREAHAARARGEGDALDGHAMFTRLKVAAALAVLDQRPIITEEDWELAGTVAAVSALTREHATRALQEAATTRQEAETAAAVARAEALSTREDSAQIRRAANAVLRALRDGEPHSWAHTRRALSSTTRARFEDAVTMLENANQITIGADDRGQTLRLNAPR